MVGRVANLETSERCAFILSRKGGSFVRPTPRSSNLCRRMCLATPEGWRSLHKVDASSGDFAGPGNAKGAKAAFRGHSLWMLPQTLSYRWARMALAARRPTSACLPSPTRES